IDGVVPGARPPDGARLGRVPCARFHRLHDGRPRRRTGRAGSPRDRVRRLQGAVRAPPGTPRRRGPRPLRARGVSRYLARDDREHPGQRGTRSHPLPQLPDLPGLPDARRRSRSARGRRLLSLQPELAAILQRRRCRPDRLRRLGKEIERMHHDLTRRTNASAVRATLGKWLLAKPNWWIQLTIVAAVSLAGLMALGT